MERNFDKNDELSLQRFLLNLYSQASNLHNYIFVQFRNNKIDKYFGKKFLRITEHL